MDDLTGKIKEFAGKLTGNESLEEEGRSKQMNAQGRDVSSDDIATRQDYVSDETMRGAGSEPYPPVRPDMTEPGRPEYADTPHGVPRSDVDEEENPPPV